MAIEDHGVVVIRLGHREQYVDVEPERGLAETIDERVVRGVIWPEQELSL